MDGNDPARTTAVPSVTGAAPACRVPAELHVVYPRELATTFTITAARSVLGRQPDDSSIPALAHKLVSRQHFALEWDPARQCHYGIDLGSQNGSWVDGVEVRERVRLQHGAVIRIGAVLLVYESLAGAPARDAAEVARDALPGRAVALRRLRAQIAHVAGDPSAVVITGETGSGKEFVANEVHRLSGRHGKLVAINCAALAAPLVESELFGHVRGAFSGAHSEQPGLFRAADGGTLLLDEIGELGLEVQAKLLRVLQEKRVRPVGSSRDLPVDVRVVASTHRNLRQLVEEGAFRRDLFARLSPWEIAVPALRERRCDIFEWLERLHRLWCAERGLVPAALPELKVAAAEALLLVDWLDNLRGLQRLVHALASAAAEVQSRPIRLSELPSWLFADPSRAVDSAEPEAEASVVEALAAPRPPAPSRAELVDALARHGGSVRATARYFQRERRQIYRWLDSFGLRMAAGAE